MMTKRLLVILVGTVATSPINAVPPVEVHLLLRSQQKSQRGRGGSGSGPCFGIGIRRHYYFRYAHRNIPQSCAFTSSLHRPILHSGSRGSRLLAYRDPPSTSSFTTLRSGSAAVEDGEASGERATSAAASRAIAGGAPPEYPLVVLIGGSGFLGSEIRRQLRERGAGHVATSTPDTAARDRDREEGRLIPLDLTAPDAGKKFHELILNAVDSPENPRNKVAVISAMGSIGTERDEEVNSSLATAIKSARRINEMTEGEDVVERFVMIGNTDRVRRLARKVPFLKGYASGKDEAESTLRECFGNRGCIIKPSFIYGGDEISLKPPRLSTSLGGLASEILGLYPIQSLADELPDALALPLAPPESVEMVASSAVNVALGIVEGYTDELAGESIKMAGSVRTWKEKSQYENWLRKELENGSKEFCSVDAVMEIDDERRWERIHTLKEMLLRGVLTSRDGDNYIDDDIAIMEEIECLRPSSMKPASDPKLNGRWNFVLTKDDLGTSFIKELLPPEYHVFGNGKVAEDDSEESSQPPPWKALLGSLYQLDGLYMRIHDEQSQVEIVLASRIFFGNVPIDIVFSTSLLPTNYDEETEGTLFLEKFERIEVGGIPLPLPSSWQRFRYLEITYLDKDIVIARGSGGEPHVLVRANEEGRSSNETQ